VRGGGGPLPESTPRVISAPHPQPLSTGGEGSAACISHAAHPSRFTELAASIARVIATVSTETRVTRVIRSMTCSL